MGVLSTRCACWIALAALALVAAPGCGRIAFEPRDDAAAPACTGDFLVDTAEDDPGEALACQGTGCSLRAALGQANARGASTICIANDLAITVATSLVVTSDVTITGGRICGAGTDRVFRVGAGGALRLRELTVCHGRLTDATGAGVLVEPGATLDADRVWFDDHAVVSNAVELEGGAVRADGDAVVEIRRSRFTNNTATQPVSGMGFARGGAFAINEGVVPARVVIEDTAFEDNSSTNVGGALFLKIAGSNLTLRRLLFARNRSYSGAAIDVNCAATGTLAIESSTFADNMSTSTSVGGVIYVCQAQTVQLQFCSFAGNNSSLVRLDNVAGRAEFHGNAIRAGAYDMCLGPGTGASLDGNVTDRDGTVCPMTGPGDRLTDPMLATLADNGGPTGTLALLPGSPAIDAAGATCPPVDQRGIVRPVGAACDAGAFEAP